MKSAAEEYEDDGQETIMTIVDAYGLDTRDKDACKARVSQLLERKEPCFDYVFPPLPSTRSKDAVCVLSLSHVMPSLTPPDMLISLEPLRKTWLSAQITSESIAILGS